MSIVSGLLNNTVDYIYSLSKDRYGTKTRTLSSSGVACRWQERVKRLSSKTGDTIFSNVEVWLEPDITVAETYEIVKDSETYKIVGVSKHYGLSGSHEYTKLYLV